MAARNHARPIPEDFHDAFADLSTTTARVGYCYPRGTTDAPRDGEAVTGAVSAVLAL